MQLSNNVARTIISRTIGPYRPYQLAFQKQHANYLAADHSQDSKPLYTYVIASRIPESSKVNCSISALSSVKLPKGLFNDLASSSFFSCSLAGGRNEYIRIYGLRRTAILPLFSNATSILLDDTTPLSVRLFLSNLKLCS